MYCIMVLFCIHGVRKEVEGSAKYTNGQHELHCLLILILTGMCQT